jgi:hypothetical protein
MQRRNSSGIEHWRPCGELDAEKAPGHNEHKKARDKETRRGL